MIYRFFHKPSTANKYYLYQIDSLPVILSFCFQFLFAFLQRIALRYTNELVLLHMFPKNLFCDKPQKATIHLH